MPDRGEVVETARIRSPADSQARGDWDQEGLTDTADGAGAQAARVSITPVRPKLIPSIVEAWRMRSLVLDLASIYLRFRIPNMILGVWWMPIRLVFSTVALAFIFGSVLGVSSVPGVPYFLFAVVGSMAWWVFDRGTRFTMISFHRFRKYVVNLAFPLILVPFAGMAALAIPLGFIVVFLVCVYAVFFGIDGRLYINFPEALYLVPLGTLWVLAAAITVGLLTGPIYWRARDVRVIFRMALPFWMFMTPVLYPVESLSGALKTGVLANPLSPPILLLKEGLLGAPGPPAWAVVSGLAVTGGAMLLGVWFTNRFGRSLISREPELDLEDDDELR